MYLSTYFKRHDPVSDVGRRTSDFGLLFGSARRLGLPEPGKILFQKFLPSLQQLRANGKHFFLSDRPSRTAFEASFRLAAAENSPHLKGEFTFCAVKHHE